MFRFEWVFMVFVCTPNVFVIFNSNGFSHFLSLFSFTTCKESQRVLSPPHTNTVMSQAPDSMQCEDSRKHPVSESRNDDNNLGCVSTWF